MKKVRSLSAPVWRGESVGDSPVVIEMEMMVRIARRRPTSVFLSWAYGLRCLDFGPSRPFNVFGLRPFRLEPNAFCGCLLLGTWALGPNLNITKLGGKKKKRRSVTSILLKEKYPFLLVFFSCIYEIS